MNKIYFSIKRYIVRHELDIFKTGLTYIILFSFSRLPYINLYVSNYYVVAITLGIGLIIFNVSAKTIVKTILLFFVLIFCLLTLGKQAAAESTGNLIYALFVIIAIQLFRNKI